jgi:hypothetical protein
MAAAIGVGRFIYTPILPPMAEGLHLTKGEAGLIAAANFLGYLAGALAAASPRLHGGARAWLLVALAVAPFAVRDAHYIKHDVPVTRNTCRHRPIDYVAGATAFHRIVHIDEQHHLPRPVVRTLPARHSFHHRP